MRYLALILIGFPSTIETNKFADAIQEIEKIREVKEEIKLKEKEFGKKLYGDTINFISKVFDDIPFEPVKFNANGWSNYEIGDLNFGVNNGNFWRSFQFIKFNFNSKLENIVDIENLNKWFKEKNKNGLANGWGFTPAMDSVNIVLLKNGELIDDKTFFRIKHNGAYSLYEQSKNLITEILDSNNLMNENKMLDSSIYTSPTIFINTCPKLKNSEVWFDVRDKTINQAEIYLKEKSKDRNESQTKPLSILGFSVPSIYAWLLGPLVIITLLLFLTIHTNQLNVLLDKFDKKETYPWIGVYDGFWNRLVFCFIIFGLPLISCFLALKSSNLETCTKVIIGFIYLTIIGAIGIKLIKITKNIISALDTNSV